MSQQSIDHRALQARWSTDAQRVANAILATGDLSTTPFGTIASDGVIYVDLRGVPFTVAVKAPLLEGIDMSHARFTTAGHIHSALRKCLFVGAHLDGALLGPLSNCIFDKALVGDFASVDVVDCSFRQVRFERAGGHKINFLRCDFSGALFHLTMFDRCRFDNCIWTDSRFKLAGFNQPHFVGTQPIIPNLLSDSDTNRPRGIVNTVSRPRFTPE